MLAPRRKHRGACWAGHLTVARYSLLARRASEYGKGLGYMLTTTEVNLVRCLAVERPMWDPPVALGHVELDEPFDTRDVVERVQEKPAMFERTPPGFDAAN